MLNREAQRELTLYADNMSALYAQKVSVQKNMARRLGKGTYNVRSAAKGWEHWYESAARMYCKEFKCSWSRVFTKSTRKRAARLQAQEFRQECKLGEYDYCKAYALKHGQKR